MGKRKREQAPMPTLETAVPLAQVALEACKDANVGQVEKAPGPSKAERRNALIAAHVALQAVRYEIDEAWVVEKSIAAALGRLELRD